MKTIPNDKLQVKDIPPPNADCDAIQRFALTFDAYHYWGSFQKCAEIANSHKASTLTELQTCLFFEQRRWRHFSYAPKGKSLAYMHGLVEGIRSRLIEKQAD